MLAVINRYKMLLIILLLVVMAILIGLYFALQSGGKTPSRGVFVMKPDDYFQYLKGGLLFCSR